MKSKWRAVSFLMMAMAVFMFSPAPGRARMEWTVKKQLNLERSPLGVSTSADGRWIFILVPREILIYSVAEQKVINRIPVEEGFDSIQHSQAGNTLIVSSRSSRAVKIIQLDIIHDFELSGLPFKGPEDAPVTIVVFFDYQ